MSNIILLALFFIEAESYVLLQVRKQDNNYSNIDALIHKVVPSEKFDKIAKKLKKDNNLINDREKANVKYVKDNSAKESSYEKDNKVQNRNIDDIEKNILNLAKKDGPVFRSHKDKYAKSKIINFRSDKPSVVFEIDSKAVIRTIKNVLASNTFQNLMEKLTKQAAVVYRAIKEEMNKENEN